MDEDFGFGGEPAPPSSRPDPAAPPGDRPRTIAIPALFVVAGLVAAALAIVFLGFLGREGEEAAAIVSSALGQSDEAADADARATLRTALVASKVAYVTADSYAGVTPDVLAGIEPSYGYTTGASTDPRTVSVAAADQVVGLAVRSSSGTCFWARDDEAPGAGTSFATGVTCTGAAALAGA